MPRPDIGRAIISNMDLHDAASASDASWVERAAESLIPWLRARIATGDGPTVVGIDGRSGGGKSTLAAAVAATFRGIDGEDGPLTVIEGDQFYAGGSADAWDRQTAAEKAALVIDWHRQRAVLEQLRIHGIAEWHPFDWDAPDWDAEVVPLAPDLVVVRAAPVIVLEGAYSCRPELHDLLDLRVLLDVHRDLRRRQLLAREGEAYRADWEARWSAAEDHYFASVMPPSRFDLVLGPPSPSPT